MQHTSAGVSIPDATYRLQFNNHFRFEDARRIARYLRDLGITHVYASPIFRASPGSQHGYDVCDHNEINPEVGTREEFDAFSQELKSLGLGLILDFVPNHMGIAEATNGWWMDVLENGRSSPFAGYFDIDWTPLKRELESKVLLPILGDQYGRVLESGALKLRFDDGRFWLEYYERPLPLDPQTIRPLLESALAKLAEDSAAMAELQSIIFSLEHLPPRTETDAVKLAERTREKAIIRQRLARLCNEQADVARALDEVVAEIQAGGSTRSFDALDALINAQPYRLAFWRVAAEEINYRRFFDINNLAAIRMELPEVFQAVHRLVLELLGSGAACGLRIDHVDGLWHPRAYLLDLQRHYADLRGSVAAECPLYLLVEKILGRDEALRDDWPVHGTTGYEFAAQVGNVLVDREAGPLLTEIYAKFIGLRLSYPEVVYRGKLLVMSVAMASEVNVLGHMLNRISETNRWYRDFTLNALTTVIREVIACFPVYRSYIPPSGQADDKDARVILRAIAAARRRNPAIERTVFEFLRDVLLPPRENAHPVDEEARRAFVMKFQQCTGPITAKGVEDTAFYVFNRLVSLNEVGGEPGSFGETVEKFHEQNAVRARDFPHSLITTSTHDTKRSEDVRARIAALSELPQEWSRALRRWSAANRKHKTEIDGELAPDANEEILFYQTILGTWPLAPMTEDEHATYVARIRDYMAKALHEAKVNTSWIEPNEAWDAAVEKFVRSVLKPGRGNRFLETLPALAARIAELGAINSLSQLVLKLTAPGVPDIYQGQELWDFSLVDPDNRRPVNYEQRASLLVEVGRADHHELFENWRDGRIKLFLTNRLLHLRRRESPLFGARNYEPITVAGDFAETCIAFTREANGRRVLVIVPRLTARVGTPPIGDAWRETRLTNLPTATWRNELTGDSIAASESLRLADALRDFPVAVFTAS